ncbi:MAG: putative tRNA-dihydrouridine synthase [Halieaceae bacterium]|nr:MAG: putative tRNA-dihydrouridine synthase [Halieaceae bacterium]
MPLTLVSAFHMQLGSFSKVTPVFLAPMAGVTDLPMRQLAIRCGADIAVGEMLSADASLAGSRKSQSRTQHSRDAGLRVVQLVGNDPVTLANAARYNANCGAEVIDINMGCPAKKVCKKAAGSALLADPALVQTILKAVTHAVSVPVTLKIRTGLSSDCRNGVEIAEIAQRAGVAMLTVHGRTRADKFSGAVEYDTIRNIVSAVDIPVIANGDITSAVKARQVLDFTKAAGVMVGRAAQGRLWLPGAVARALQGGDYRVPDIADRFAIMREHIQSLHGFHGETMGHKIARKHAGWFFETELGEQYARFKREFNALSCQDAQTHFIETKQAEIVDLMLRSERNTQWGTLAA